MSFTHFRIPGETPSSPVTNPVFKTAWFVHRERRAGLFYLQNKKRTHYLEELRPKKQQGQMQVNVKVLRKCEGIFFLKNMAMKASAGSLLSAHRPCTLLKSSSTWACPQSEHFSLPHTIPRLHFPPDLWQWLSTGTIPPPQGTSGNVWRRFWLSQLGRREEGHTSTGWVEARDAADHVPAHRTAPQQRISQPWSAASASRLIFPLPLLVFSGQQSPQGLNILNWSSWCPA